METCDGYLLSGTTAFNQARSYTNYPTSLGEVVIDDTDGGACLACFAQ